MIKIVYDIGIYRKTLNDLIKEDDIVVEIGSHVGGSTRIIAEKTRKGRVIAVDKSPQAYEAMKKLQMEYPNLEFIQGDVRLQETLKKVHDHIGSCDVLAVDLGGGHHPDTTFKVYFIWSSTLKPRTSIIRNRGLLDFANSSKMEEDISSDMGWLESSSHGGVPPRLKEFKLWSEKLY
ncbi:class I SAM-dependent methyltransferase [Methanothermobacter tenebrarum]